MVAWIFSLVRGFRVDVWGVPVVGSLAVDLGVQARTLRLAADLVLATWALCSWLGGCLCRRLTRFPMLSSLRLGGFVGALGTL